MRVLELIRVLKPRFWFIENPRGRMRAYPPMSQFLRRTVYYSAYGHLIAKPTDIWTNHCRWRPRPQPPPLPSSKRFYTRNGREIPIWDSFPRRYRLMMPPELCREIIRTCLQHL